MPKVQPPRKTTARELIGSARTIHAPSASVEVAYTANHTLVVVVDGYTILTVTGVPHLYTSGICPQRTGEEESND